MEIHNPDAKAREGASLIGSPSLSDTLKALVEVVPAMVWLGDDEGRTRYFNDQFYSFTGLRREDDDGYMYMKVIHPDDDPKRVEAMACIKAKKPISIEVRHRGADGNYRWYLVRAVPMDLGNGITYIGTNMDIDDHKRTEHALQKSEDEFRTLAELIPQLVSVCNADGRTLYANKRYYDFFGVQPEAEDGFFWQKVLHPEDLAVVIPQLGSAPDPGVFWESELRYRAADGNYKWHLVRAVSMVGNDKIFVTMTDIDEQKRASEAIRESEIHLRTLAEAIPQIVWTADVTGTVTFVNQRYFEYTGLTVEQSVEGAWKLLIHPDDLKQYEEGWKESLATGDTFECYFRLKRAVGVFANKSNDYRKHLCRAIAFRGSTGNIIQWFATWTDVEGPNFNPLI